MPINFFPHKLVLIAFKFIAINLNYIPRDQNYEMSGSICDDISRDFLTVILETSVEYLQFRRVLYHSRI